MHHGQRGVGRPRTGAGPAGGARRRPGRSRGRAHHQQGLRLGPQGGHARRPGRRDRRCRRRRGRRHGVDEQLPVPHPQGPRGAADGRREGARRDDARRTLVLAGKLVDGAGMRSRRRALRRQPRRPGRVRGGEPPPRRRRHSRVLVQGRDPPRRDPAAQGRSAPAAVRRGSAPRHVGGGAGTTQAGLQEGRLRHRRQRPGRQRRGGGRRRDGGREGGRARRDADGAHRGSGRERPGAPLAAHDAGAGGHEAPAEGRVEAGGRRSDRAERGVLGPGAGRHPRTRRRPGPRQRQRRGGSRSAIP